MSPDSATLLAPPRDTGNHDGSVCIQELSLLSEGKVDVQRLPRRKQQSVYGTVHSDLTTASANLLIDKKRKQRPASGTIPTGRSAFSLGFTIDKKRGNRTSVPGDRYEGEVVTEGMLMVAEQEGRGQTKRDTPMFRTLGAMYCVLTRKRSGLLFEIVATGSNQTIELNVNAMDLVLEPRQSNRKFQLRNRARNFDDSSSGQQGMCYVFMASTKGEYVKWVNGIHRFQAFESGERDTSVKKDDDLAAMDADRRQRIPGNYQKLQRKQEVHQHVETSLSKFMLATPPRTKHMILVRHGHYINAHVPHVSDSEQVLSQMGRQQAEFTGICLRIAHNRIPKRHNVTIYHSDLTRAVEAATIIASNFSDVLLNSSSLLREGWPGTPYASSMRTRESNDDEQSRMDSGRMQKAFDTFFLSPVEAQDEDNDESYCILVCHANLIRFFLCRALGIEATNTWGHFEINHCGITRIDVCASRPIKVLSVNETGHLPQSLITSSEDHL